MKWGLFLKSTNKSIMWGIHLIRVKYKVTHKKKKGPPRHWTWKTSAEQVTLTLKEDSGMWWTEDVQRQGGEDHGYTWGTAWNSPPCLHCRVAFLSQCQLLGGPLTWALSGNVTEVGVGGQQRCVSKSLRCPNEWVNCNQSVSIGLWFPKHLLKSISSDPPIAC